MKFLRISKFLSKKKKNKCRKTEYFNKKKQKCITKKNNTKHKNRFGSNKYNYNRFNIDFYKEKSISLRRKKLSKNSKYTSKKDTRIFIITGHSNICYLDAIPMIRDKKEFEGFRVNLKKKHKNLKKVDIQGMGRLNTTWLNFMFLTLLEKEESLYKMFLGLDSIESTKKLDKLFKKLLINKKIKPDYVKIIKKAYQDTFTSFNIYPKKDKESAQNPINTVYNFDDIHNSENNYGVFEITKYNESTMEYDIDALRFLYNPGINNIMEKQKTQINDKIKKSKNNIEIGQLILDRIETTLMLPNSKSDEKISKLLRPLSISYTDYKKEYYIQSKLKNIECDLKKKLKSCNGDILIFNGNIICKRHYELFYVNNKFKVNLIKSVDKNSIRKIYEKRFSQHLFTKEYSEFQNYLEINERIFREIEKKFKKLKSIYPNHIKKDLQIINNISRFSLNDLIEIIIEIKDIKPNEKIIVLDFGCKGFTNEKYINRYDIPSISKRESTIKVPSYLFNDKIYEEGYYPYIFEKLYKEMDNLV